MPGNKRLSTVYLSADDVIEVVNRIGLSTCIAGVAERIERVSTRHTSRAFL